MKAVVVSAPGEVGVAEVPDPSPAPDEVVLSVASSGICSIDLRLLDGETFPGRPVVPGHEFGGEVVAIGSDVRDVTVGERVGVYPYLWCGRCRDCRLGRPNLCTSSGAIGVSRDGGCAPFAAVPARNCVTIPEHVDPAHYCLIEPISSAVRGFEVAPVPLGGDTLVYGAGTMGLLLLQLARRAGAARVGVVDRDPVRRDLATSLGAHAVGSSAEEVEAPHGWDLVVDATGNLAAIEDGIGRVAAGGQFLQFGVADRTATIAVNPHRVYQREITITGSMVELHQNYERAVALVADGVFDLDPFLTHWLALEDYPEALRMFRQGNLGLKFQVRTQ